MSIARTTPAQKLRGLATRTRFSRPRLRGERARGARGGRPARAWRQARCGAVARGSARNARATARQSVRPSGRAAWARRPTGCSGVSEIALTTPARRPVAASAALSMSTATAPVSRASSRRAAGSSTTSPASQTTALSAPGTRSGSCSQSTVPSASTMRRALTSVPGARPGDERAGEAEGDEPALGQRQRRPAARRARHARRRCGPRPPRPRARRRASSCSGWPAQRNVHARLLTVSFTLEVVAIVAAGSKPEWIPQCSQRWSLPGP